MAFYYYFFLPSTASFCPFTTLISLYFVYLKATMEITGTSVTVFTLKNYCSTLFYINLCYVTTSAMSVRRIGGFPKCGGRTS